MKRLLFLLTGLPFFAFGQPSYGSDTLRGAFSILPELSDTYRFVVVADRAGGERRDVFRKGAEQLRACAPDFVVAVGDLIDGYTTDRDYALRMWAEFDALSERFGAPFYSAPGNHDYSNRELAALWNERFGRSYYAFRAGSSLFLVLNTEEILGEGRTGISDAQAAYFLRVLEQERSEGPMFVVMHTPLWFTGTDPNYNLLEEQFLKRDVTVFSGHTHRYYAASRQGRPHYNLATMGGDSPMRGVAMGEFDHFFVVDVCRGEVAIRNVSVDGTPLPLDAVNEQSRVPVEQLAGEEWLHVVPTVAAESPTNLLATDLVLTNPSELPLRVSFRAPEIPHGRFEPAEFTREVRGNSCDTIPLRLFFDRPQSLDDLPPVEVACVGCYRIGDREVSAPAGKRWLADCIRRCGATPLRVRVDDPFYVREDWDWHSTDDGRFLFEVSLRGSRLLLRIETSDDVLITDPDPEKLQDRLIVLFTPEGAPTRRIELTAGATSDDDCRAVCRPTDSGLEAELSLPAEGIRRFNLNIGFVDCDNILNTKPSQLWWRPLEMRANEHADYGTFLVDSDATR